VPEAGSCSAAKGIIIRSPRRAQNTASCGASLREKVIDVSRRLSKSALSFQVHAGRGDAITLGVENCDLITVIAFVAQYKFAFVGALCGASTSHRDKRRARARRSRAAGETLAQITASARSQVDGASFTNAGP
jgi:hypothetical protein